MPDYNPRDEVDLIQRLALKALAKESGAEQRILTELSHLSAAQQRQLAHSLNHGPLLVNVPYVHCETDSTGAITQLTFTPGLLTAPIAERISVNNRIAVRLPITRRLSPSIMEAELFTIPR